MLDGREIQTLFRAASLRTLMAGAARVLGGLKSAYAGLRVVRVHDLRHSSATIQLYEHHAPIQYVSEQPGHASIKITVDTYGHPRQGTSLALADTLDSPGGETVRCATGTQLTSVE